MHCDFKWKVLIGDVQFKYTRWFKCYCIFQFLLYWCAIQDEANTGWRPMIGNNLLSLFEKPCRPTRAVKWTRMWRRHASVIRINGEDRTEVDWSVELVISGQTEDEEQGENTWRALGTDYLLRISEQCKVITLPTIWLNFNVFNIAMVAAK